ncbi:C2H2 type master regulator of conidiophore development brlA, partial [Fusarium oxysporum f. sp. albedinis]
MGIISDSYGTPSNPVENHRYIYTHFHS